MSSNAGGSHSGGDNEDIEADEASRNDHARLDERIKEEEVDVRGGAVPEGDLEHNIWAEDEALAEEEGSGDQGEWSEALEMQEDYAQLDHGRAEDSDDVVPDEGPTTPRMQSPIPSPLGSGSIPDDTPSLHGSLMSSPDRGASPLPKKRAMRNVSGALQPFERRFEARPAAARSPSSRTGSPAFLTPHSRQISISSQISQISSQGGSADTDTPEAPWDVVRWTKLRKITSQAFSEAGRRNFGRPTCLAVSALIAVGTSKGLILGFDYHQTLKIIIGQGTKATECGSVTALAIAADYSTIAAGHANGHIFTWEINRPSQPFLRIPPLERNVLQQKEHPDGHVVNCAILHVGFLGTRHTALVSADSCGMAFSHLATRGLGPVTRTIKSTRLLGRYPPADPQIERSRKPSSVLAFSPLPLGNVEQPTDNMGLTALLTPYLLVIVSTTPVAQTQHKSARPKEISPHSTLSGCLAWFPAVKLKTAGTYAGKGSSDTKLVYCWSNVLTVLDVKVVDSGEPVDSTKPASLEFHSRSRWRAEEAIVAVQWLGRSVLGVLTISQRLMIVEDGSLQVTDSIDLLHRHVYHQDLFSQQLKSVVEQLNSAEPSLHGVVADAFYMSFRVYKGRTFLLGFNDLTVGTLSNWADRLMALMEAGDHIAAIRLATEYYGGGAHNVTVGLPDVDSARHSMVRERLLAMISASLNYTFSQHDDGRETRLRELAAVCFDACVIMCEQDHLFGNVFEIFEDADEEDIFTLTLEPFVLDDEVTSIPPEVVKTMVAYFISENQAARLEELLCRLEPLSFDLDQITMLCRQHSLFDALIYIWTQGIGDFVTPLIDLMSVIKLLDDGPDDEDITANPFYDSAMKTYPYLAYSLTGRRYPGGESLDDNVALQAKADLYEYLFSGRPSSWPPGGQKSFRTATNAQDEPAFPYLVLLLRFDTPSFMSMLNEAFEDAFLNSSPDESDTNGAGKVNGVQSRPAYKMTRQYVISILLDVMKQGDFDPEQIIYMDMFVARSLPKYPGQLVLSGSLLNTVLQQLCRPPTEELREECELSVEYLLSAYHPSDQSALINDLREARFYRVLKSVYRGAKMLNELLETYFEDPKDKGGVFDRIAYCLRSSTGLNEKQRQSIKDVVQAHTEELAEINTVLLARTLATHAFDLLQRCIADLQDSYTQFVFLRALLEPTLLRDQTASGYGPLPQEQQSAFVEHYVQLMCKHDPTHVADYVGLLPTGDLRLDEVLPVMEDSGVVDAAVVLLTRDGLARDAMDRLATHLQRLQHTLVELIDAAAGSPDFRGTQEAAQDLVDGIEKYTKVGSWLCQGQSANAQRRPRPRTNLAWEIKEDDLDLDEYLWLNLVDVVVQVTKSGSQALRDMEEHPTEVDLEVMDVPKLSSSLRSNVQQAFTALLAATATPSIKGTGDQTTRKAARDHLSFLRVLRTFLTRAATTAPSISDLRAVLSDVFSAYTFEEGVLSLAYDLLGSDVFADIEEANDLRQRGWRPRTQVCEHCKRRAWGPGIGEIVWEEWIAREQGREADKARKLVERGGGEEARRLERGKAKAAQSSSEEPHNEDARRLALVVFACRHVFHKVCLDADYREGKNPRHEKYKCPLCIEPA
ncbi:Vacuolar protein sorting-associated protein 8 [Saxophila tyrrhenica]|uniref:Vacuolar protein sorting-associated protein 8 n=1 Tax=Saxophila tyrrhenica TaxID=1690608 RepID=A0AAV9PIG7_9PEZI|nr:Vacuolar protein sorting-associated protein 8 [Saxophila tyrrhenica]